MKYFKIIVNYGGGNDSFVSIDENELEIALYIFTTDGKAVFKNGVVRGKDIISITEDWHKALGINPEWKLGTDDWNEIEKQGKSLLKRWLKKNGQKFQKSDDKTFDLIVDGNYAELKAKGKSWKNFDFISLTKNQKN